MEYTNGTMPASANPVARPTMFCSETPTLKKRSGKASENGSRAMKPRSAVSKTIRGSRSASSTSVRTKALRMASASYFANCKRVLLVIHWQVVPADLALHERDALSECRMCDESVGQLCLQPLDCRSDRLLAVAVHAVDIPAKGSPAVLKWFKRYHVLCVAQSLLAVHIHDGDQVVQPMVRRKHRRFPNAAF